jgi:hypothetical protein
MRKKGRHGIDLAKGKVREQNNPLSKQTTKNNENK